MERSPQTNVRLSDTGRKLLEAMADMQGITHRAVLEMAIRELAKAQGIWEPLLPAKKK
jgi:hypothetical protein